jgi:CRISP-associated protein Cas1
LSTPDTIAFVYDVADLYKATLTIPLAFDIAAEQPAAVASATRRRFRDTQHDGLLLTSIIRDLQELLLPLEAKPMEVGDVISLWDDKVGKVSGGVNYEEVQW